jgi:hypothetical protein
MIVPKRRKLTDAIKNLLENETGRPVGIGTAPVDLNSNQAELPYLVMYPIGGSSFFGPQFCGPESDVMFEYQVNSEAKRYDQADWLADLVREILIDRDSSGQLLNKVQFDGYSVMDQEIVGPPGKLEQVGQIWCVIESYGFTVTGQK